MAPLPKLLLIAALLIASVAMLIHFFPALMQFGRLPGDIRVERPGFSFYLPVTSSLIVSAVLSLLFWLAGKLR